MQASEINKYKTLLNALFHKAIVETTDLVADKCRKLSTTPQEPDFVAGLTLKFSVDLFNILKAVFSKQKFAVTAVYCHQKPIVNIGETRNPELGDLLLVYIYTDKRHRKHFNSLLLQAKVSRDSIVRIPLADRHQFKLYNEWPAFTYLRAGSLNGEQRDILPKTINDGAQYLLIDNDPLDGLSGLPGTFPMGCAIPADPLVLDNDLVGELVDFLKFKSGRLFEKDHAAADDWTKMIWDLLALTLTSATRRKNAGMSSFPRQITSASDGSCVYFADTNSIFTALHQYLDGKLEVNVDGYPNDEPNPGVSLILIECSEETEG